MYSRTNHRFITGLIGFAGLALVVPSLALGVRPDDSGSAAVPAIWQVTPVVQISPGSQLRPDNRAGGLGATPITASVKLSGSDDAFMRAVSRHSVYTVHAVRPDDRAGALGADPITIKFHTVSALQRLHRYTEFVR
jgi:hypothetical protein